MKEWIEITSLNVFPGNPRKIEPVMMERLKTSIRQFSGVVPGASGGFRLPDPIIVNDVNKNIVGGNQRARALIELNQTKIHKDDISWVHIEDPQKEKALNIALNRITGDWDDEKLKEILMEMDNEFMNLSGFDDDDLADIVERLEAETLPKMGLTDDDDIPEEVETICKTGDLWQLGEHRLLCGDATKKEDCERLMGGEKADMVFTDPPYGVDYAGKNKYLNAIDEGNRIQTPIEMDELSEKDIMVVWKKAFEIIRENLKETNSYYIFGPQIQGMMMMMMMMMEAGLPYRHVIIWVKNNHVLGRCDYNYKHEPIFFGWTTKHRFYKKGEFQTSVWNVDKPHKSDLHPTMKPVRIVENALLNSSLPPSIILDPFGGSGTTLIACEKLGRKCCMLEISPHYVDVILKRFEDFTGIKPVLISSKE